MKAYYFQRVFRFVLLLTLMSGQYFSFGQDVTFQTQAEVDAFDPSTTVINGDLRFEGMSWQTPSDISNLATLSNLETVNGNLSIVNTSLDNLSDLNNLTTVKGNFRIGGNQYLTNITEFDNLTSVGDTLTINSNTGLISIDGFSKLSTIGKGMIFITNSKLKNISGFVALSSIGGSLTIYSNFSITRVNGMSNLTLIGEDLEILNNPELTSIIGFKKLSSINSIKLDNNKKLNRVSGAGREDVHKGHFRAFPPRTRSDPGSSFDGGRRPRVKPGAGDSCECGQR